jgi:transmembrane sensor
MHTNKDDIDFERKLLEMEIPLKNLISEEEKETSWKNILLTVEGSTNKEYFMRPFYWMAAASVLIIIGVTLWLTIDTGFKTNDQEKLTVALTDGSSVTLNYESQLNLADGFGHKNRGVSLEGEAFFNIKKDEAKPFVITIGQHEVIVVGTSFNVRYKDKLAEITVRFGKVQLHAGNRLLNLKAGEKGVISSTGELSTMAWDSNDFAWYSKTLTLKEKSLKEVAEILSKLFSKKVEVDPSIAFCTMSAKIEYETIEDILTIMKETLGITWKYDSENKIYIDGKGC